MFKKLAAAALTCALAVSVFTGCGSDTQTKAERPKDELVFVNYRDIRDLNPHLYDRGKCTHRRCFTKP